MPWAKLPERPEKNSSNTDFDVFALIVRLGGPGSRRHLSIKIPTHDLVLAPKFPVLLFRMTFNPFISSLPAGHLCHQGLD
jgi:hypothetical protein